MLNIATTKEMREIKEQQKSPSTMTLAEFDKLPHQKRALGFSLAFPDKVHNVCAFEQTRFKGFVSPDIAISTIEGLCKELRFK
jgi:hypothetical protein